MSHVAIEFLLHEGEMFGAGEFVFKSKACVISAMAQLQLALLGETEEFMEETNKPLREQFFNAIKPVRDPMEAAKIKSQSRKFIHKYSNMVLDRAHEKEGLDVVAPSVALNDHASSVFGPLTARMANNCPFGVEDKKLQRVR